MALSKIESQSIATGAVTVSSITDNTVTSAKLTTTGVAANTYGNTTAIPVLTIDASGRITNATTSSVSGVTGLSYTAANSTVTVSTSTTNFDAVITSANSTVQGLIQVIDSTSNTSTTVSASANSVKTAYDAAGNAYSNAASYADAKAANAYSNAASYADAKAANAYSNAASYADAKAANAYSNAASYADAKAANAYSNVFAGGTFTGPVILQANLTSNNVSVTGSMQIDGDLTVSGNSVAINVTNLSVEDNMIYLNANNTVTNPDLGFAGNYNDGTYRHAGLFRDATDGVWKFFHEYVPEPDASAYIDTSNNTFALANVQANTFIGTISATSMTVGSNVAVNTSVIRLGNSTTNATMSATGFTINGASFIANTTGAYHTGTVNAASLTTTGFVANTTAIVPTSNTILLGNSTGRFVISANTIDTSGNTNTFGTAVYIAANGNVGIGTSSPTAKLHVVTGVEGESVIFNNTNTNINATNVFGYLIQEGGVTRGRLRYYRDGTGRLELVNQVDGPLVFGTNNTERARITSDGNLIVGDTSSGRRFKTRLDSNTVYSTSDFETSSLHYYINNASATIGAYTGIQFAVGSNGDAAISAIRTADGESALTFGTRGSGVRAERMRISSSGSVGIGTSSPTNTVLWVKGEWVSGHSTVKVQTPTSFAGGGTTGIALYDSDGTRSSIYYHSNTASVIGSTVSKPFILTTNDLTRLTISAGGDVYTASRNLFSSMGQAFSIAAGGSLGFNIEALGGVYTSGILYVMGRENGLNQTIAVYSFNLSYYGVSGTRYIRLLQISRNTLNNSYGDVYAYVSSYAASWTSTDQSHSGTSSAVSDIYFRNAVGAGCQCNYLIHFTGS